jgi:hypothetical protein
MFKAARSGLDNLGAKTRQIAGRIKAGCDDGFIKLPGGGGEAVFFGQKRIGPTFSPGAPSHLAGRNVSDVASDLRSGKLSANDLPIDAFRHEGKLVTMNNRSLAALSEAGLRPSNVNVIPRRSVPDEVLDRLLEAPLVGGPLPSPHIAVTRTFDDKSVLRVVTIAGF